MPIFFHVYFNFFKLVYSVLFRRDIKFLCSEIIASISICMFAKVYGNWWRAFIFSFDKLNLGIKRALYAAIFGGLFILFSFASRFIPKSNKLTKGKRNEQEVSLGIIDFCWIALVGIVYSGIIFSNEFSIFNCKIQLGAKFEYYNLIFDETKYWLDKLVTIMLALGTILAACMAIIWSGEIWRKDPTKDKRDYKSTTLASIRMAVAFFIIVIAMFLWIGIPLYQTMDAVKDAIYWLKDELGAMLHFVAL